MLMGSAKTADLAIAPLTIQPGFSFWQTVAVWWGCANGGNCILKAADIQWSLMLSVFKPAVERSLRPLVYPLRKVHPNLITSGGLIFPVLFFVFILHHVYVWALAMLILMATDMLDGLVARAQNKVSAFGGFFDSTVDRFADFVVLVAFGFAELVSWEIVLALVLLSFLISYIRSRTELASKATIVANVGIIERTERLIIIFMGLSLYAIWPAFAVYGFNLLVWAFVTLIILSAITVAQRFIFAYRNLK